MMYKSIASPPLIGMPRTPLSYFIAGVLLLVPEMTRARDYYFSPSSLEGGAQSQSEIDLSLFSKRNAQLPGVYASDILLNKQKLKQTDVSYINGPEGELQPQLTPSMLQNWGIRIEAFPKLAELAPDEALSAPIGEYIPAAATTFDFNSMTLRISMPQAAINTESLGYIDPSRWDDGVPVAFTDYAFSGSQHIDTASSDDDSNQYLNLRSGVNLGGWRLRNYSTLRSDDGEKSWETINTWIQHDIDVLKAQFTLGESSTQGEVFDSVQYKGINIRSDQEMLPYSQRGFAPTIRGIANSNAEVSIRQNGYLIYQASVAPGAFEIRDLYSTTNSGDLDITVKEADGSEHHFTQPYSSLAVMQRPGHIDYEVTVARYRSDNGRDSKEPEFAQGSLTYGINNYLTFFGGLTASEDYFAVNSGVGIALGTLGAISTDVTWADTTLDNSKQSTGQSWRLLYSGKIDSTDTNFTLAGYRYSTEGYYSFADANRKYDSHESDWGFNYNKRNRLQASISQTLFGSSIYFNGYQQDYWGNSEKERSISAGLNRVINGISFHMAYSYNKMSDHASDRMFSFGFSLPLSKWLPNSWTSYNISNNKQGDTRQSLGFSGTLLDDQRLNYSLQQSYANHDGQKGSSIFASYRSQYANLNAGYDYSTDGTQQLSYGMSGGIVAHPHGVTLSQPLGDEFAIIHAPGAPGIRFQNHRGVQTDRFGNAIIPSLTAYQENSIRIDTSSLPDDVDTNDTAVSVIPSRNAAVNASITAQVGYRALITLTRPGNKIVPFGAVASLEKSGVTGIVDDSSVLYLAGINENTEILVKWGNSAEQQCIALVAISAENAKPVNAAGIHTTRALCK